MACSLWLWQHFDVANSGEDVRFSLSPVCRCSRGGEKRSVSHFLMRHNESAGWRPESLQRRRSTRARLAPTSVVGDPVSAPEWAFLGQVVVSGFMERFDELNHGASVWGESRTFQANLRLVARELAFDGVDDPECQDPLPLDRSVFEVIVNGKSALVCYLGDLEGRVGSASREKSTATCLLAGPSKDPDALSLSGPLEQCTVMGVVRRDLQN